MTAPPRGEKKWILPEEKAPFNNLYASHTKKGQEPFRQPPLYTSFCEVRSNQPRIVKKTEL